MKLIRYLLSACACFFCVLFPSSAYPIAPGGFFNQFPNRYFVETGTWEGHGVIGAIIADCFPEIHSIELSEEFYQRAVKFFPDFFYDRRHHENINIWKGDSGVVLADVIRDMREPITFWLDAHFSGNTTAKGETNTPVLRELECIKNHPIKTHTILIDDVRLFGTSEFDFLPLEVVINKIKEINPAYVIEIRDGYPFAQDILVARVLKGS